MVYIHIVSRFKCCFVAIAAYALDESKIVNNAISWGYAEFESFHNSVYTPCKKGRFETAQCCYCEFTCTHCCSFDFNFVFIHACCLFVEAIICQLITSYCFIFF